MAQPAVAQDRVAFDIPATTLDAALIRFAGQAQVSVDASNRAFRSIRTRRLKGRFTKREALRRLLRGSGYDFRLSSNSVVQITKRPDRRRAGRTNNAQRPSPGKGRTMERAPPVPIVVSATKQDSRLADYPGSVYVADLELAESLRFGGSGSEVLLRELPNLTTTGLGPGRNKIFIRGVADSSFNGQTQSTISQYLGESRLVYSSPDPDLLLYDVEKLEVVEGPQGTLYGAGSLGGVIRVVPRPPKLDTAELAGTAALSVTQGELGGEIALVGNLPVSDNSAARVTAYHVTRPGYIDDLARGLSDINRTEITGVRAAIRLDRGEGPVFDAGLLAQNVSSRDGQYSDSGPGTLTRRSAIAEPFDNDYRLAYLTVTGDVGAARLTSNTSFAHQFIRSTFDATPQSGGSAIIFNEDKRVSLFAHETRLAGSSGALASWVGGFSLAYNADRIRREIGPFGDLATLGQIDAKAYDGALFGEATIGRWNGLALTLGGRLSYVKQVDEVEIPGDLTEFEPERSDVRILPTVALSWKPSDGIIAYARYREGYRPGAAQVTGEGPSAEASRFEADEIRTKVVGVRFGAQDDSRFWGGVLFSYSRWDEIQADLVTPQGFPFVANLGSGFVRYTSVDLGWKPVDAVTLAANAFMTTSELDQPSNVFAELDEEDLPNIADEGFQLKALYQQQWGDAQLTLNGTVSYIGSSFLAIGAPFDLPQGKYFDTSMGARVELGNLGVSLDVDNVLDERANRFSFGNPFTVAEGNQRTPLRPRTIRIGIDARF